MSLTAVFLSALKQALRTKNVTYKDVARELGLSESSVKRIMSDGTMSVDRLSRILELLDMSFTDFAMLTATRPETPAILTTEQERHLAADPHLFAVFNLLLFGESASAIVGKYAVPKTKFEASVITLEELGLVERRKKSMTLLCDKEVRWLKNGPLAKRYGDKVKSEFLAGDFETTSSMQSFVTYRLSHKTLALAKRKIGNLLKEIEDSAAVDRAARSSELKPIALMFAMRPFSLSEIAGVRKKRQPSEKGL